MTDFQHTPTRPKVAVIGAGWAGLSAAAHLCTQADVTVFEAGKSAGGRARALGGDCGRFEFLDNGQHILLGAYHGILNLLQKAGIQPDTVFARRPLQWHMMGGVQFKVPALPAPWHLLVGVLQAEGCKQKKKTALLLQMQHLKTWHRKKQPDITVAEWLYRQNVSAKWVRDFWQPLVVGALNTPLRSASLKILTNVLHDGVWAQRAGSDYLLPLKDLSTAFVAPLTGYLKKHHVSLCLETRVPRLVLHESGKVWVNGGLFDAAVMATAPYHAEALLPKETPPSVQAAYVDTEYHSITTVYLRYAETVTLPAAMTGLPDAMVQWFIARGQLGLSAHEVAAVTSVSDTIGPFSQREWIAGAHKELLILCPYLGAPVDAKAITEKRATVAASVTRNRPDMAWLHSQHIYPAGDYTHPRYPATLEGAVQSGQSAAELCLHNLFDKKVKGLKYEPTTAR